MKIEKLGLQLYTIRDTMNTAEDIRESFRKIKALGYDVGQTAGCAIPFAEFEITPEKGMELGFTFSVNSTNEVDKVWKNVTYRNGGGIIGRNDWSKIPVITLD